MLVLSRHKGEAIQIGDVTVIVMSVRGDKVRLGFLAPPETPIHRLEVVEAMKAAGNFRSLAKEVRKD